MKTLLILLICFGGAICFASSNPHNDPNAFLNLITSSNENGVRSHLSEECVAAISALKDHHEAFHSDLLKQYLIPIKKISFGDTSDGLFFHYTERQAVRSIVERHSEDEIFSFLRGTSRSDWFFYVAGDDRSSRNYGGIQIQVSIDKNQSVYMPMTPDFYLQSISPRITPDDPIKYYEWVEKFVRASIEIDLKIENEITSKSPSLSSCMTKVRSIDERTGYTHPILVLLALEEDRVPLIGYYGTGMPWFQVMGRWAIDSMKVGAAPN